MSHAATMLTLTSLGTGFSPNECNISRLETVRS